MNPRILIACTGNIFLGDDGFGVEVAQRLAARPMAPGVVMKDFGIRSLDLIYALLEAWDLVILVDACRCGGEPGTLYLIEPDEAENAHPGQLDAHSMNPGSVLRAVRAMGGASNRVLIAGCEPEGFGSEDGGRMGLSAPVAAAVDDAVELIEKVIRGAAVEAAAGSG